MSISSYKIRLATIDDFDLVYTVDYALHVVKCWRNKHSTSNTCDTCSEKLRFRTHNFICCCDKFYFRPTKNYVVKSIAVKLDGIHFLPERLRKNTLKLKIETDQSFLALPDPLYWQIPTTLTYETTLKYLYATGVPSKKRKITTGSYHEDSSLGLDERLCQKYNKIMKAPLNHSSIEKRSEGKKSFFRGTVLAKRAENTARAMIIPAPHLKPNQVALPEKIVDALKLKGWVVLNRMPTLLPDNFTVHKVAQVWKHSCIGIPCEILKALHADFDGDEVNLWPVYSWDAQAECEAILNCEKNMRSFTNGIKLHPSQDMKVAFYLNRKEMMRLLPPLKTADGLELSEIMQVVYEVYGSETCFRCFDALREYYLDFLENDTSFSISFEEFEQLKSIASSGLENFEKNLNSVPEGCLQIQVKSKAKGTTYHLYQLVGSVGEQYMRYASQAIGGDSYVKSSFMDGLTPEEYIVHVQSGYEAIIESMINVWKPGYNYFKLCNSMQGVIVDYAGRLMDDKKVISNDVLTNVYHEDVMCKETYLELMAKYFD